MMLCVETCTCERQHSARLQTRQALCVCLLGTAVFTLTHYLLPQLRIEFALFVYFDGEAGPITGSISLVLIQHWCGSLCRSWVRAGLGTWWGTPAPSLTSGCSSWCSPCRTTTSRRNSPSINTSRSAHRTLTVAFDLRES